MKKILFFLLLLPFAAAAFQKPTTTANNAKKSNEVRLICKVYDFPKGTDSLTLFELNGLGNKVIRRSGFQPDSTFLFVLPAGTPRFYGIGIEPGNVARVILGSEPEVKFYAYAFNMPFGRTSNSPTNKAYETLRKQVDQQLKQEGEYAGTVQQRRGTPEAAKALEGAQQLQKQRNRMLDSLKTTNAMLWQVASLRLVPGFIAETRGEGNEFNFVGNDYFRNTDFSKANYDNIPDVFNAFENYAKILGRSSAGGPQALNFAEKQLAKIPEKSNTYRMALGGLVSGFKDLDNEAWIKMANRYVEKYRNNNLGEIERIQYDITRASVFMPGFVAPDIVAQTPEDKPYALSAMRGKVILVDFWASWCGPCRRENPNVKILYDKYKDKGFDILGVSLDRDKASWVRAIEQDGLPWKHISDLGGWQSAPAQLYGVTSIPQTILLDKDGKIIERNLRGELLAAKLRDIFGE
jgi:thiol-disulfide isomerase/thioredoxin